MPFFDVKTIEVADITDILRIADNCGLSPWSRQNYLDELGRQDAIMLRIESADLQSVGFIVGRIVPGGDKNLPHDAEIYNIGVLPDRRRLGLGRQLMEAFLSKCRSAAVGEVWLDVRVSNRHAIDFYKRAGFAKYSIRKSFYADPPEDGIVMRLELGDHMDFEDSNKT